MDNLWFLKKFMEVLRKYGGFCAHREYFEYYGSSSHSLVVRIGTNSGDCTTAFHFLQPYVFWVRSVSWFDPQNCSLFCNFQESFWRVYSHSMAMVLKTGNDGFSSAKSQVYPSKFHSKFKFSVVFHRFFTDFGPHDHLKRTSQVHRVRPPHRRRGDSARCARAGCGGRPPWSDGLEGDSIQSPKTWSWLNPSEKYESIGMISNPIYIPME